MGGVMTKLIDKNTTIPTSKKQIFSTATDNQPAVTIRAFQGERKQASANKLLGQFDLTDIPASPRGIPQIEVAFDIDSNGILKVSAKNLSTNKEQNMVIKASSGLSDDEIKKMIKDAEINAEADKKFDELVALKNRADNEIHSAQKAMDSIGDKINIDDKNNIEKIIKELKDLVSNDNKNEIEEKINDLNKAVTLLHKATQNNNDNNDNNDNKNNDDDNTDTKKNKTTEENVVDADYEEIKNNKK